jgi:nucleoside-diphosphate-sugar epimerase
VFEFARRPGRKSGRVRSFIPFDLGAPVAPALFRDNGVGVLIHCAYDFGPTSWDAIRRVNVEGTRSLFSAARAGGVETIVFISSISAFDGCQSLYGKAKLATEAIAFEFGAVVIRPGLVYGSHASGGMFGALQRIASRSHPIPLIGSGRYPQYLVHEDDLCEVLLTISGQPVSCAQPVVVAASRPWSIREVLEVLRRRRHAKPTFIPIPWQMIWLMLKTSELCGVRLPFRSDSVISLVRQNVAPDFSVAARMGFQFRELDEESLGQYGK